MACPSSRWCLRALGATLVAASGLNVAPGSAPAQTECITLEDFAGSSVGRFPTGWRARKAEGEAAYIVREEARHAASSTEARRVTASRRRSRSPGTWMPTRSSRGHGDPWSFPRGGDERNGGTNDSALAVYMLVDHSRIRGPESRQVRLERAGTRRDPSDLEHGPHPGAGSCGAGRQPVASGSRSASTSGTTSRSIFSESETPKPAGIGVLTDSDDTNSSAQGDYGPFRACRR